MKKKIFVFICSLLLICACAMPAFADEDTTTEAVVTEAAGEEMVLGETLGEAASGEDVAAVYKQYVVDEANLLDGNEASTLSEKLAAISEKQQFDVVVVTAYGLNGKTPMEAADDFYDYNNYGWGENRDGCLLLISMEERDWWISTCGYGITALTDYGIQEIGDLMLSELSEGNYVNAFNIYADAVDEFVSEAKNGKPYDTNHEYKDSEEKRHNLIVAFVVAVVISLVITGMVKSSYKPVKFSPNAADYLVPGSMQLNAQYDHFLYSNVSRVKRESSSSGGGSSTHTSSSGSSHGGGGGKF